MADAAIANTWTASLLNSTFSSITVSVSGQTAGNVLVAIIQVGAGGDTFTVPATWTKLNEESSGFDGRCIAWKIADGDSTDNFDPTWTDSGQPHALVMELANTNGTIDQAVYSWELDTDASIATGSVTPTSQPGIAIVLFGAGDNGDFDGTGDARNVTISDGFTKEIVFSIPEDNDTSKCIVGGFYKRYTSLSAISATVSGGGAGGDRIGTGLLLFPEAGGGGAAPDGTGGLHSISRQFTTQAAARLGGVLQ